MDVFVFVCVFALENVWGSIAVLDRQKRDQAFFADIFVFGENMAKQFLLKLKCGGI